MYKIVNRKKLAATMLADLIGNIVFLPRLFRKPPEIDPEKIHSILIIRTAYIGDVIMALPVLKPLKERFPHAQITFLTSTASAPLLVNNPFVDHVITYDPFWFYATRKKDYFRFRETLRQMSFDMVIEMRGDIRELLLLVEPVRSRIKVSSGLGGGRYLLTHVLPTDGRNHRVDYHLDIVRYLGCKASPVEWGIYLTDAEEKNVKTLLAEAGAIGRFIAVHPGSRMPLKKWPLPRCAELYDRIAVELNTRVVILGSESDRSGIDSIAGMMKTKAIDMGGMLDLRSLAGVIGSARAFVCNDSAPMHIAACLGIPTVAIFGPSKSTETGPYGAGHNIVEMNYPCRLTCDEGTCRQGVNNECMTAITSDHVLAALRTLLT